MFRVVELVSQVEANNAAAGRSKAARFSNGGLDGSWIDASLSMRRGVVGYGVEAPRRPLGFGSAVRRLLETYNMRNGVYA